MPRDVETDTNWVWMVGMYYDWTPTTDLDPTTGTDLHPSAYPNNGFVVKMSRAGAYQWGIHLHGRFMQVEDVAVCANGVIAVSGKGDTLGMDLDPGPGIARSGVNSAVATFVAFYDAAGNYMSHFAYSGVDFTIGELATDEAGDLYVGGILNGIAMDLDPTPTVDSISSGSYSAWMFKMDVGAMRYEWSRRYFPTVVSDEVWLVDVESHGGLVMLAGNFTGTSLNTDYGQSNTAVTSGSDPTKPSGFVALMDTAGNLLDAAVAYVNNDECNLNAATLDRDGNVYLVLSTAYPLINGTTMYVQHGNVVRTTVIGSGQGQLLARTCSPQDDWLMKLEATGPGVVIYGASCNDSVVAFGGWGGGVLELAGQVVDTVGEGSNSSSLVLVLDRSGNATAAWHDVPLTAPQTGTYSQVVALEATPENDLFVASVIGGNDVRYDLDMGPGMASTSMTDPAMEQGGGYVLRLDLDSTFIYVGVPERPDVRVAAFPNPTGDVLRLSAPVGILGVEVNDLQGRVMRRVAFRVGEECHVRMAGLAAGVYVVRVRTEAGEVAVRVVRD